MRFFLNFFDKIKIATVDKTGILYLYHTNRYFSDRLRHCIQIKRNCCYKQKKWFAEAYEDYLVLKASQKK
jgi:hypothetical protein